MIKTFLTAILLSALFSAAAYAQNVSGSNLGAGLNGSLTLGNLATAGSQGATGAGVSGSVQSDVRGTTTASSWASSNTSFNSTSMLMNCGPCDGMVATTNTSGYSDAQGSASIWIGPRIDPASAEYAAYGESSGDSRVTQGFELNLDGYVEYREYERQVGIGAGSH